MAKKKKKKKIKEDLMDGLEDNIQTGQFEIQILLRKFYKRFESIFIRKAK